MFNITFFIWLNKYFDKHGKRLKCLIRHLLNRGGLVLSCVCYGLLIYLIFRVLFFFLVLVNISNLFILCMGNYMLLNVSFYKILAQY